MSERVVVASVGMMTAVGLTAAETAASVRAGTMRNTETDLRDKRFDRFTLAEIPEDGLPPLADQVAAQRLTARERRMLRVATTALRECAAPLASADNAVLPIPLCLALPEGLPSHQIDGARFAAYLSAQVPGVFDPTRSDASHTGRAGSVTAVGQAVLTIQQGLADFVLAGGVDSYRDLFLLGSLDAEQRVKSETSLDGFIPGEGAAFLILASARACAARGLQPLASVSPVAAGFETGHLYSEEPYRGDGLAATVAQVVAQRLADQPIGEVYSSMNGESHWAKEWGVAYMRNRDAFLPVYRMHHPADSVGDTGAASGTLMVGLAAVGIRNKYRRSPALVYGSSDRGPRAALVVASA